jgi:hypothetical protein
MKNKEQWIVVMYNEGDDFNPVLENPTSRRPGERGVNIIDCPTDERLEEMIKANAQHPLSTWRKLDCVCFEIHSGRIRRFSKGVEITPTVPITPEGSATERKDVN